MIDGLDVSAHQSSTPSLTGQSFLIARAAYGLAADARFGQHVAAARRAGLVTGAYLFLRHRAVRDQVSRFLELAWGVDLLAIDLENDSEPATHDDCRAAIAQVQDAGRSVLLYHSTSGYPGDALGADGRWVADYRPLPEPPVPWDLWQWTSFVGGVHLDRNRFDGTRAELRHLGGASDMRYIKASDGLTLPVKAGERWRFLDGSPGGRFPKDTAPAVLGVVDGRTGQFVVRIVTGIPYPDAKPRPTDVLVVSTRTLVKPPAPPQPADRATVLDEGIAALEAIK